jgi:spermidine/putrescine transport system ATP-binding protein
MIEVKPTVASGPAPATPEPKPTGSAGLEPPIIPSVEVVGVTKVYGGVTVLRECNLTIGQNEFVSLLGPSGSGKTTLLRIIGGFVAQDAGTVRIHGECVDGRPANKRPVNTVFQSYALFPHRTVLENVVFPLEMAKMPRAERNDRAGDLLKLVGLAGSEKKAVTKLSGGQAQRVALARALAAEPEVLLLDEPLNALDLKLRHAMQVELRRIHEETSTTFVFVTHDQGEALAMSDRVVLLSDGRIVQDGSPEDLYDHPATPFASDFLGSANLIEGTVTALDGDVAVVNRGHLAFTGLASAEMRVGERAVVSIRPERLRIDPPTAGGSPLSGTITGTLFLGHLVRCQVRLADDLVISVEAGRDEAADWQSGQTVELGWRPEHARVMQADSGAGAP